MPTQILGLGGSLRAGSGTVMALNIALAGAEEQGARTRLMDLASLRLPLFNGSDGIDGYSSKEQAAITSLLDAVDEAQGVILGSPTYHNTISGSLKNALDFLEILREDGPSRFTGKNRRIDNRTGRRLWNRKQHPHHHVVGCKSHGGMGTAYNRFYPWGERHVPRGQSSYRQYY